MFELLTKCVSMRVALVLMACVVSNVAGAANAVEPAVTVAPLLLKEPSTEVTTTELSSVGVNLTDPGELLPGDTVYLEIWIQVVGPAGIASALLNMEYETAFLDTSVGQITLSSLWMNLWVPSVDDTTGLITDVGGLSAIGRGLEPQWAKLATIEFDVIETPATGFLTACTLQGGPLSGFGIAGIGRVDKIDYRCACAAESNLGTLGNFAICMSGPNDTAAVECTCSDIDQETHVDLADFAAFQVAFRGD